jgi:hypothetical protein
MNNRTPKLRKDLLVGHSRGRHTLPGTPMRFCRFGNLSMKNKLAVRRTARQRYGRG